MKTTKQTAGNNATLAAVRKLMNDAIYRTFAVIYNASGEGDALQYLSQYFNVEGWTRTLKSIPQTQDRGRDYAAERTAVGDDPEELLEDEADPNACPECGEHCCDVHAYLHDGE